MNMPEKEDASEGAASELIEPGHGSGDDRAGHDGERTHADAEAARYRDAEETEEELDEFPGEDGVEKGDEEDGDEKESVDSHESPEAIEEPPLQERRRGPEVTSVQELIATLPTWARNHAQLLRSHLTGVIALTTTDPSRTYRIDWTGDRLIAEAGDAPTADCRVTLSQGDVMRVVRGELNPQIGMLSGRIKASGNPEMAMYLFNLIVRR